jgi:signal transduction histidine kinase
MNRISRRYQSSFEEIRDPLLIVDAGGVIRASNPAARALLDFDDAGDIGDLQWLDRRVVVDGETLRALVALSSASLGTRLKDSRGDDARVVVDVIPLAGGHGPPHVLVHFRDYSPYEKYERWKDELISMAAHEIKNPLFAMRNSMKILATQAAAELSEGQRNLLGVSLRSIDRLTRLVDNLLDVSRIGSGSYTPEPRWIDARETTAEVVETFRTLFNARRHKIDYSVAENIGRIYVDAPKLEQILINLLNNAVKFTPEGGEVTVCVEPASREVLGDDLRILPWPEIGPLSFVRFSVKDTGIGMTGETISHLFTRYYRENNPSGSSGFHLGLSISKTLAEVQNGTLECESELGVGTRVSAALPADEETFALVGRVRSMERVLGRLAGLHRDATLHVLSKNGSSPWERVFEAWTPGLVVEPAPDDERSGARYAWTFGERAALVVEVGPPEDVTSARAPAAAVPGGVLDAAGLTAATHKLSPRDLKLARVLALAFRKKEEKARTPAEPR